MAARVMQSIMVVVSLPGSFLLNGIDLFLVQHATCMESVVVLTESDSNANEELCTLRCCQDCSFYSSFIVASHQGPSDMYKAC